MKKDMDKIQFEYRYEVQELMKVIDKYVKQNPAEKENKTLEQKRAGELHKLRL